MRRLPPDLLLVFTEVARSGGIGRAAEALHLTQPAVSNQMKVLQDRLGAPVYRREGRGIALTPAGRALMRHGEAVMLALERAEMWAEGYVRGATETLEVRASHTIAAYLLPHFLVARRAAHPDLRVRIHAANSDQVLASLEHTDIALLERPVPGVPSGWMSIPLSENEIVLALPASEHVPAHGLTLAETLAYPLIWREQGSGTRALVEQAFREAGLVPRVDHELWGLGAIKDAVAAGLGAGFVSRLALHATDPSVQSVALIPPIRQPILALLPLHADTAARSLVADLASAQRPAPANTL